MSTTGIVCDNSWTLDGTAGLAAVVLSPAVAFETAVRTLPACLHNKEYHLLRLAFAIRSPAVAGRRPHPPPARPEPAAEPILCEDLSLSNADVDLIYARYGDGAQPRNGCSTLVVLEVV